MSTSMTDPPFLLVFEEVHDLPGGFPRHLVYVTTTGYYARTLQHLLVVQRFRAVAPDRTGGGGGDNDPYAPLRELFKKHERCTRTCDTTAKAIRECVALADERILEATNLLVDLVQNGTQRTGAVTP